MFGRLTVMPGFARGDWRTKVLYLAQLCVGAVALLGYLAFAFKAPLMILAFASTMGLLLEGAELRAAQAPDQDTLDAAEGSREDLEQVLRYLLGEM